MVSTSVNLPPEMVREIDRIVEESNVFESRSHYLRVCHREYQDGSGLKQL